MSQVRGALLSSKIAFYFDYHEVDLISRKLRSQFISRIVKIAVA